MFQRVLSTMEKYYFGPSQEHRLCFRRVVAYPENGKTTFSDYIAWTLSKALSLILQIAFLEDKKNNQIKFSSFPPGTASLRLPNVSNILTALFPIKLGYVRHLQMNSYVLKLVVKLCQIKRKACFLNLQVICYEC